MKKIGYISLTLACFVLVLIIGSSAWSGKTSLEPVLKKIKTFVPALASWFPDDAATPSSAKKQISAVSRVSLTSKSGNTSTSSGKMQISSSPGRAIGERPSYLGGEDVKAAVIINGESHNLRSNQRGNFGRVYIDATQKVNISLAYPPVAAEQPILMQAEDGGVLLNAKNKGVVGEDGVLDANASASINFQAGVQPGIYRVTILHGSDMKQIDFWVGPPPGVQGVAVNH